MSSRHHEDPFTRAVKRYVRACYASIALRSGLTNVTYTYRGDLDAVQAIIAKKSEKRVLDFVNGKGGAASRFVFLLCNHERHGHGRAHTQMHTHKLTDTHTNTRAHTHTHTAKGRQLTYPIFHAIRHNHLRVVECLLRSKVHIHVQRERKRERGKKGHES